MLTINMLGKGAIFYDKECISDKLSSKLVALVCLLVLNKNRDMSREKIITYLWPDSDDEAAKSNLRFNLWNIRKAIPQSCDGEDFIITGKDYCRINEKYPYECDKTMLDGVKVSQLEKVEELLKLKELFKGDFLEGLYLRNCNEFNEMILFERVVCQNKQVEILEKLIGLYEEQEKYEEELQILNEVAAIEPYNEQFAYQAVHIYGKLGNRTAAINYYKNFEIVLRRNLNTSPNDELKLLYKELLESSCSLKFEQKHGDKFSKRKIEITVDCMKDVEYFGAASLLDSLMEGAEKRYISELDRAFLNDLSYIYSGLQPEHEKPASDCPVGIGPVPPVRVAFAFLKMMDHLSRRYELNIRISDLENMDQASRNLIDYLEKRKNHHINIQY
ncbi:MAG: BTAD domain-containing putative transcriptional regulator [Eubacteriales bacterium]|nr:BTAD domain-containing putative transcriptional regulator [Eubacteriales bacterium]